jgi:hypothetical protein
MQTGNNERPLEVEKKTSWDVCCWECEAEERNVRIWAEFCARKATLWWNFDHFLEKFTAVNFLTFPTQTWKKMGMCVVWASSSVIIFCEFRSSLFYLFEITSVTKLSGLRSPELLILCGWGGKYDNTALLWMPGTENCLMAAQLHLEASDGIAFSPLLDIFVIYNWVDTRWQ